MYAQSSQTLVFLSKDKLFASRKDNLQYRVAEKEMLSLSSSEFLYIPRLL